MSKGKLVKKDENDEQEEAVFVPVKGLERLALLDRAEEALTEARNTRISLLGKQPNTTNCYNALRINPTAPWYTWVFQPFLVINALPNILQYKHKYNTGPAHKDSLYSSMHLASLLKMQEKPQEALVMLDEALVVAEEKYTKM